MELKLRQIAYSDILILNKTDLVGHDEIGRIRAWLDEAAQLRRTAGNLALGRAL
jgi:G3E family GTPase